MCQVHELSHLFLTILILNTILILILRKRKLWTKYESKVPQIIKPGSSKTRIKPQVAWLQNSHPSLPHHVPSYLLSINRHRRRGKLDWVFLPAETFRSAFLVDSLKASCVRTHPAPHQTFPLGFQELALAVLFQGALWRLLLVSLPSAWFPPAAELWAESLFLVVCILWTETNAGCWPDSVKNHFNHLWEGLARFPFELQFEWVSGEKKGRGLCRVIRMAGEGGRRRVTYEPGLPCDSLAKNNKCILHTKALVIQWHFRFPKEPRSSLLPHLYMCWILCLKRSSQTYLLSTWKSPMLGLHLPPPPLEASLIASLPCHFIFI